MPTLKLQKFFGRALAFLMTDEVGQKMYDGTVYAGISPDTGTAMYIMPQDVPGVKVWKESQEAAEELNKFRAYGHGDWRLASEQEWDVLHKNRSLIGEFNEKGGRDSHYWSNTPSELYPPGSEAEGRTLCSMSRSGSKMPHANIINRARVRLVRTAEPIVWGPW